MVRLLNLPSISDSILRVKMQQSEANSTLTTTKVRDSEVSSFIDFRQVPCLSRS